MGQAMAAIGWTVLIACTWWAVGYAINSLVLYPIARETWPRQPRSRTRTPDWYYRVCYVIVGPVGWVAWWLDR